jgi:hypothetical protein
MTPVRRRRAVRPPDLDGGAGGFGLPLVNHPGRATAAAPAVRWQVRCLAASVTGSLEAATNPRLTA